MLIKCWLSVNNWITICGKTPSNRIVKRGINICAARPRADLIITSTTLCHLFMHSIAAGRKIPSSLSTQTSKVLEEMMIGVNRVMAEEHLLLEYGAKLVRYLLCAIVWRKVSHISWHVLQCNRRGKSHRGSINSLSLLLLCNLMFYSQVKDPLLRLPLLFKTYSVHASVKQQQLKQPP